MRIRPRSTRATLAALAATSTLALAPVIAIADGGGGVGSGGGGGGKDDDGAHAFPVDGKHTYGDGFGAGRGHQGQDILSDCREHVVASNAGRVTLVDYQGSGAGNYLVLRERGEDTDSVYMHLHKEPFVKEGDKVEAGDKLGLVGTTGSSSTCHLHYEFWTAPGWQQGDAKDPEPMLRKWDRQG